MIDNFPEFRKTMEDLNQDINAAFFKDNNPEVPHLIYHYTDAIGLENILRDKKWRATHSSYLNDSKELFYADEMMIEILKERLPIPNNNFLWTDIYEDITNAAYGKSSVLSAFNEDFYIVSFSQKGDLLDQWRAYASDGNGYSIGIDPWELKNKVQEKVLIPKHPDDLAFVKVNYAVEEQKAILRNIIDKAMVIIEAEYNKIHSSDQERFRRVATACLGSVITKLAPFYKHWAFENEQEWRIVRRKWKGDETESLKHVSFRSSRNMLIPYMSTDFTCEPDDLLPLKKIYLGPKLKNSNAENSLEMYLKSLGYKDVMPELEDSVIPYR